MSDNSGTNLVLKLANMQISHKSFYTLSRMAPTYVLQWIMQNACQSSVGCVMFIIFCISGILAVFQVSGMARFYNGRR